MTAPRSTADVLQAIIAASLALVALLLFSVSSGCASTPERIPEPPRPTPSLVGQHPTEAENALKRAGLTARYTYRYAEVDADWVVEQTPETGVPIVPPAPVEVVVISRSPRP